MIKLITPKRDLYLDGDASNPEGLFGKKGKFYKVKGYGYAGEDIMFIDERGVEHSYGVDFVDKDFWTVDFDKGFEFRTGSGDEYSWIKGTVTNISNAASSDWSAKGDLELAEVAILGRSWNITRYSNQQETSTPDQPRPYENWKKDIGEAKFHRCLKKVQHGVWVIEGLAGYLDSTNKQFFYQKEHSYLCCKVEKVEGGDWRFLRHNKDTDALKKIGEHGDLVERDFPNQPWRLRTGKDTLLEEFKLAAEEETLMDELNTHTDKILASFGIPVENKLDGDDKLAKQGISKGQGEAFVDKADTWTDKHYDFSYKLTEGDIEAGEIKIDPYFVADQWKLGEKDNSGVIFHILKTCSRYKCKHEEEREIRAIYGQIKRLAEMRGVSL